jgi:hypothetical protein
MCSRGDYRVLEPPKESSNDPMSTFIGQCLPCPEGTLCDEAGVTVEKVRIDGYYSDVNCTKLTTTNPPTLVAASPHERVLEEQQ